MSQKIIAWSASKLKAFEQCPFKFFNNVILKRYQEPDSEAQSAGTLFHKAMQQRVASRVPLPKGYAKHEPVVAPIDTFPGKVWAEHQMALTEDRRPTTWFGHDCAVRAIADVCAVAPEAMLVIDWKTGKLREDDLQQLDLTMAVAMEHFPDVPICHGLLYYTQTKTKVRGRLPREGVDAVFMMFKPRVDRMRKAHELEDFPARRNYACDRFCLVRSCSFNKDYAGGDRDADNA